jgi:membrane protease YdiL (CAAX protease family)
VTENSQPSFSGTLLRAFLWLAIAFVAGTAAAFVVGFVCGLVNGAHIALISQANLQGATFIGALVASAFCFRRGALREAGRAADPRIRASVAPGPIRRWPVVILAALILTPFGIFLSAALAQTSPAMQQANTATNPVLLGLVAILIATVTPYAEEIFFRGWLWAALTARTGVITAGCVSGLLFLLAHGTEALLRGQVAGAIGRAVILLPLAIGLCVVRAVCGTPRASMIVHGLYNFAVTAAPPLLIAAGLLRP